MNTAIWWIRRDLRLTDNQALSNALAQARQVIPVFIFDPLLLRSPYVGPKRLTFLLHGLQQLAKDLQAKGSYLIVRQGAPVAELQKLVAESQAEAIFAEADYSPYARRRDEQIANCLPLQLVHGLTIHAPTVVLKANGAPYTVYTPFQRTWKKQALPSTPDLLAAPEQLATPPGLTSVPLSTIPALPEKALFVAGEAEAQRRLHTFLGRLQTAATPEPINQQLIYQYAAARNRMDWTGTAQLSPYLRFGMVSARQVVVAAQQAFETATTDEAREGATTWLNELIWREFYVAILYHFPHVRTQSFRPAYTALEWENNEAAFAAWCEGRTGYPVIDAAMRQLTQTGWMHNRARMIVAAFLVKDLLIDWRWGERYFMQHLIDGDPAANNGGWQWSAGTGTDATPYFRIFNPITQSEKFDPEGAYIRRWVPELVNVPLRYLHAPWKMPLALQQKTGCLIGKSYPAPLVDHDWARERTLVAYRKTKQAG